MGDPHDATPGVIRPGDVYRLDEFLSRMQWGKHAWRTARRNGLRPCYAGGQAYVRGVDAIRHLNGVQAGLVEVSSESQAELHSLIVAVKSHDHRAAREHLARLNDAHGVALTFAAELLPGSQS